MACLTSTGREFWRIELTILNTPAPGGYKPYIWAMGDHKQWLPRKTMCSIVSSSIIFANGTDSHTQMIDIKCWQAKEVMLVYKKNPKEGAIFFLGPSKTSHNSGEVRRDDRIWMYVCTSLGKRFSWVNFPVVQWQKMMLGFVFMGCSTAFK